MDAILLTILVIAILGLLLSLFLRSTRKSIIIQPISENYKTILSGQVPFYNNLNEEQKPEFENRVQHFLATTRITGVNTVVEDIDRVLVAASAVIPIFNFPGWEYVNLHEVLLYPDSLIMNFSRKGLTDQLLEWSATEL